MPIAARCRGSTGSSRSPNATRSPSTWCGCAPPRRPTSPRSIRTERRRRAMLRAMPTFAFQDILEAGHHADTPYRKLTGDFVRPLEAAGRRFLEVAPEALTLLTRTAMRDIAHLLRPGHLAQLRKILDDSEASANDHFVALELLKNANIAAGGVLPGCQDTGTAIVMGKRGQHVLTQGGDEAAIARGVFDTYLEANLRYSQVAPLDMFEEKNTGNNLPAQ